MKTSDLLSCLLLSSLGAIAGGAAVGALLLSIQAFFSNNDAGGLAGNMLAGGTFGAFLLFIAVLVVIPMKNLRTDEALLAYWLARLTNTIGLLVALVVAFGEKEEIFSGHAGEVLGRMMLFVILSTGVSFCQYAAARLHLRAS